MFREMRRHQQVLSREEIIAVLQRCTSGVLACLGDDAYPYAVPLNYVYYNEKIYFHSAKAGHKIDAISQHEKVSFAVIDEDTIVSEELTSYFRSVVAFGSARIVSGAEWLDSMRALVEKYAADLPEEVKVQEISACTRAHMIAIDIQHLTGKEAGEYAKAKRK